MSPRRKGDDREHREAIARELAAEAEGLKKIKDEMAKSLAKKKKDGKK
ncbi:hypothetical protein SAMN04489712_105241 [Thermomonospora echinospora]|uniref:Uncharacterized protein n=1 Tax=Thermomonospora echinospora TaxID=1992 RepID=A0A1H6A7E7_9ACTN|nr:hypothetical protein [Thermomonospora echinospora]SEG44240.1 hypothetical protein SAMN04489712_105241 [Thermomonospora echinospora]